MVLVSALKIEPNAKNQTPFKKCLLKLNSANQILDMDGFE
jgi:hypothetical protein